MSNIQKFERTNGAEAKLRFELAVIEPVKGKRGNLKFYRTVFADNVTSAVSQVRREVEGSGLVVLQAASYHAGEPVNPVIINRLIDAYELAVA